MSLPDTFVAQILVMTALCWLIGAATGTAVRAHRYSPREVRARLLGIGVLPAVILLLVAIFM